MGRIDENNTLVKESMNQLCSFTCFRNKKPAPVIITLPTSCQSFGKSLPMVWQCLAKAVAKVCQRSGKKLAMYHLQFPTLILLTCKSFFKE